MTFITRLADWIAGLRFTVCVVIVTHDSTRASPAVPDLRHELSQPQREAVALLLEAVTLDERRNPGGLGQKSIDRPRRHTFGPLSARPQNSNP